MINNDTKIQAALSNIDKEITKYSNPSIQTYHTNCVFKDGTVSVNIRTVNDIDNLVGLYAYIIQKNEYLLKSATELGVTPPAQYKICGYSIDNWRDDIKNRIKAITQNNKSMLLKRSKERLLELISEDAKTEMELNEILGDLSKINQ